jgi:AcrR family transcriptional regulator
MSSPMVTDAPRPSMRRDATRNRSQLIAAAREVFAEFGPDAPLEEVASRASVSRTTLYRNFATRQDLATEIYARDVTTIEAFAAKVRGSAQGIVELFDLVLGMMMDDRSLFHVVLNPEMEWYQELVERLTAVFEPFVQKGKAAGIVREDVTLEDFRIAFGMAQAGTHNVTVDRRKRIEPRIRVILRRALFAGEV